MADNFTANAGSGGSTFAADDVGAGLLVPRVKVTQGADGTATDVSSSAPLPTALHAATTGGLSMHSITSAASTNATNVKASAGKLHGWVITNKAASNLWVKIYNTAGTPTAGSGTPVIRLMIPTGGGQTFNSDIGITFGTGIGYTTVTTAPDSGSTSVAADDLQINLFYI